MELQSNANQETLTAQDRRSSPRFSIDTEATLVVVGHGLSMTCRVLDLSRSGCRMRTEGSIPAGVQVLVEVTFSVNRIPFRIAGVTRRSNGSDEVGIEFTDMSPRRTAEWAEVVDEVQALVAARVTANVAEATE